MRLSRPGVLIGMIAKGLTPFSGAEVFAIMEVSLLWTR